MTAGRRPYSRREQAGDATTGSQRRGIAPHHALLLLFLEPPRRFFLGWRREVSPDKRPAWLALALLVLFLTSWSVEPVGRYFGIHFKPPTVIAERLGVVLVWFFSMRTLWRARLFARFLGLDP